MAWVAFAIAAAALASRFMPVTNHTVLILAALSPYLMTLAGLSALLFSLTRRRWSVLAALVLTALAVVVELPMFIGPDPIPANTVEVRVLTANLYEGAADPKALVAIARNRADLVVVEELTPDLAKSLAGEGINADFPYSTADARPFAAGVGIWSRYPVVGSSQVTGYELGVVSAVIQIPDTARNTMVLAAHLVGPWPQPIDGWRQELATFPDTLHALATAAGQGALIVAGDFNATFDMRPFRRLLQTGFRDAAEQSGAGLTPTYSAESALPPDIGIDHVLTLRSSATDVHTVRIPGSDHLGLIASVHVPR
ncbi:endonuclease/exonuclease/phosphatase family protein [Mycolicibacterium sp.]|uniref:endonuclease/exonuclease/phosphatase family protein n=1 Tax=Mycolicibacterium sp. TaxID=2320850 RepID=UPI001A1D91AE|nr:endonuclease/exonuclease/phosphatase family protein [Mycolicibacterium sp.]MBJ7339231.1 endonuclease/exonuclease/phosphatase family protein [Mycolicibacterium sp.]